jgi:outer membrane receptor protein involved in Fe transport
MSLSQRLITVTALLLLAALAAFGQGTTSTLSGTVSSDSGPLPGATISVSSPSLQGTRTTVSGATGTYNIPGLPPGPYTVTFTLEGMQPVIKKTTLQLAQTTAVDASLRVSAVTEAITVTATSQAVLESAQVASNITNKMLDKLPVNRTILGAVSLSPGVSSNGINGAFSISGAPSYDNVYLVNGTVVNENLRGAPENLFIEDAVQEVTVFPAGSISAEYGRFTGGVVSTITKSGGNEYSASVRDSLSNAKWTAKTPFRDAQGNPEPDHVSKLNGTFEETLGGYLLRDRLWFFGAGRQAKTDTQRFTSITSIPYDNGRDEKRVEAKLTGQVTAKHNIVASYLDIKDKRINDIQFSVMDLGSLFNRQLPNSLFSGQYNGVITSNLLATVSYSRKKFAFVGSGSPFTDIINGTLMVDNVRGTRYWTSTFCGTCGEEDRNNFVWSAKGNYFLSSKELGSHNIVGGVERFNETRLANNHQSGSDFRIIQNTPARIVNGVIYPVLDTTATIQWNPIFNLAHGTHLVTKSAFVNDKWDLNNRLSFQVGLRYDKNAGRDDDGHIVSNDSALGPRLGVSFDVRGDGKHRIFLNAARYVSKISDGNVGGSGNAAGNPSSLQWRYGGPVVNGLSVTNDQLTPTDKALGILWNWFNNTYCNPSTGCGVKNFTPTSQAGGSFIGASISGLSTIIPSSITSPSVDEITLGYGTQLARSAYVRVDLVKRDWHNFYSAEMLSSHTQVKDQFGNPTDVDYTVNDDHNIKRTYRGVDLQAQWRPSRFYTGGSYTYSKLRGNDLGETAANATIRNTPGQTYYPEYFNYAQRLPVGWLPEDTRHRLKAYAGYDFAFGRFGTFSPSLLQTVESGIPYSALGTIDATGRNNFPYTGIPVNPGYTLSNAGTQHSYYFGERGGYRTPYLRRTDLNLGYDFPLSRMMLFARWSVTNLLNQHAVLLPNQVVLTRRNGSGTGLLAFNPFTDTPIECPQGAAASVCSGMKANWQKGPDFGKPTSVNSYQAARTYAFTFGARF